MNTYNKRFFEVARNITIVICILLLFLGVYFDSYILRKIAIIAFGFEIIFGSRVNLNENSRMNKYIGSWGGVFIIILSLYLIIKEIGIHQ